MPPKSKRSQDLGMVAGISGVKFVTITESGRCMGVCKSTVSTCMSDPSGTKVFFCGLNKCRPGAGSELQKLVSKKISSQQRDKMRWQAAAMMQ